MARDTMGPDGDVLVFRVDLRDGVLPVFREEMPVDSGKDKQQEVVQPEYMVE